MEILNIFHDLYYFILTGMSSLCILLYLSRKTKINICKDNKYRCKSYDIKVVI